MDHRKGKVVTTAIVWVRNRQTGIVHGVDPTARIGNLPDDPTLLDYMLREVLPDGRTAKFELVDPLSANGDSPHDAA